MNVKDLPDSDLLHRLSYDHQDAFDEIYKRYWNELFRSAFNVLKDKDACMDIVQEVFIWLWEHRHQINISSLKPYLHTAVKFKVANHIKKGKIRSSFFEQLKDIEEPQQLMEDSLEVKEMMSFIQQFAHQLPNKSREIFLLSRQQHLSNREIAESLNISVKTVENQMTIVLRKLRSSLAKLISLLLFML
ncbi:RNA polymerase sigma-70 factor [Sphingobacterium thalpophilum]|uniref:RNA polymerase sigma-70 factor n=1 Tax=Sphingobacterium thalpophilum TaxID=259 RepID=UPI003C73C5E5